LVKTFKMIESVAVQWQYSCPPYHREPWRRYQDHLQGDLLFKRRESGWLGHWCSALLRAWPDFSQSSWLVILALLKMLKQSLTATKSIYWWQLAPALFKQLLYFQLVAMREALPSSVWLK